MNTIVAYATNNLCYQAAQPMKPTGLLIHSTGANNPNLKRYVNCPEECGENPNKNYWDNPTPEGYKLCVHAFIGYDKNKRVRDAQILPYNIASWGCGKGPKGSFNYNPHGKIQVELCEDSMTNATYFKQVWEVTVDWCVDLCKRYDFDPLKEGVLVGHAEAHKLGYASGHADPEHWFKRHGKSMDALRAEVAQKLGASKLARPEKTGDWYVQIGAFNNLPGASQYNANLQKLKIGNTYIPSAVFVAKSNPKYIVYVGYFKTQKDAEMYAEEITKLKLNGIKLGAMVKRK